ncbi:MAG: KamA family radical SAM protein [Magnetococcus sp. YQC-9]
MNKLLARLTEFSEESREAARQFPLHIPPALATRLLNEPDQSPLLRQFIPSAEELHVVPGYSTDPLNESAAQPMPGLIAKYPGRVLLKVTPHCAVHCRFCFRRHARNDPLPKRLHDFEPAFEAIAADDSIREVILSGGDPLTLSNRRLQNLITRLSAIDHLTRLRIHTRIPVLQPRRVTPTLIRALTGSRLTCIMVIHVNHAAEIDKSARQALDGLVDAGIPLLNQSVLLRGVNDDVETLAELCTALIDSRVMPYYLHMLDPVAGAAHFEVDDTVALQLVGALRARLPGYAVPRLVREVPGMPFKLDIPNRNQNEMFGFS